ncbi:MAG: ATP-binding protein [Xanthobacteraceae bacterium]|nr:ATP-binding protein [Xanthobacteraceae bacterium]
MWRPFRLGSDEASSRLLQQFLIAAAITIFCSMTLLAYAVSHTVQSSLTLTAAEEGALLIDVFLGPSIQELATSKTLSQESSNKLDNLLKTKLGERMKVVKIWLRDGTLVYSTNKHQIGEQFPSRQIADAFGGEATGTFNDLDDPADQFERQLQRPLVEIYAPLYVTGTKDVIAVGEIYNNGERLAAEINTIQIASIAIVAAVTAPMMFVLFLMVRRASATVDTHRKTLKRKVIEATALASQNNKLRHEANDARMESVQSNERLIDQIGQDLHDGPIQLLSILRLKLSELIDADASSRLLENAQFTSSITELVSGTLADLRDISTGLVLPQLDSLTTEETLWLAVRQHENMTGTMVRCEIDDLPLCPLPMRTCLFRIIQEALNNAYHYANGHGQHVVASADATWISVAVYDSGAGATASHRPPRRAIGLGITGLRRRVDAFQGTFEVSSRADGTCVSARLPLYRMEANSTRPSSYAGNENPPAAYFPDVRSVSDTLATQYFEVESRTTNHRTNVVIDDDLHQM